MKKNKWIKFRHKIVRNIVYYVLYPYTRLKYNIKIDKFKDQGKRAYLILMNHQTGFDQFFVGMTFKGPVYYVASEDIFSLGFVSKLIKYLVAPIPIKKQTNDLRAVLNCLQVAKEGGTICLAPEGNRTYSGKTEYIKPSIVKLIKALKLPVAFLKIEGGYGIKPRWSDVIRKGKMHCFVSKVLEKEEYLSLKDEDLYDLVKKELYEDDVNLNQEFFHQKNAEYLERVIYVCPHCGLSSFKSKNAEIFCEKCSLKAKYLPNLTFQNNHPFRTVNDWYEYQNDYINNLEIKENQLLYQEIISLYEVNLYKNKSLIEKDMQIELYFNKIVLKGKQETLECSFDKINITLLGKNKLNLYIDEKVYQIKGNKRFNGVKYVNLLYHYKNIKEKNHDKFLGL